MPYSEENDSASDEPTHVSQLTVEIIPVWSKNVRVWLRQVEAKLFTKGIARERTKHDYVLGNLDTDVAEFICNFLDKRLSTFPYQDLCQRLISDFEESEIRKVTKLMNELKLGNKKLDFLGKCDTFSVHMLKMIFLKLHFLNDIPPILVQY